MNIAVSGNVKYTEKYECSKWISDLIFSHMLLQHILLCAIIAGNIL
jgi:hypothetical protein